MNVTMPLMAGKRGLIMGVANERSIAWGIAKAVPEAGAELAFTFQGEVLESGPPARRKRRLRFRHGMRRHRRGQPRRRLRARSASAGAGSISSSMPSALPTPRRCAAAMSIRPATISAGPSTSPASPSRTSAGARAAMMTNGGSLLTLTYYGAERVMPNYNVMGVAKAALEASVRYLAVDLGRPEHPRQRDLGRADQDPGGLGHRRFPLYPEMEPVNSPLEAQRHDRGCRQRRALSAERPRRRRHRRGPSCRCRLSRRRHEDAVDALDI